MWAHYDFFWVVYRATFLVFVQQFGNFLGYETQNIVLCEVAYVQ